MKKFISDYLHFSHRERNGLILLLTAIVLVWTVPPILRTRQHPKIFTIRSGFARPADSISVISEKAAAPDVFTSPVNHPETKRGVSASGSENVIYRLHDFDPNSLSENEWKKFGISDHAIHAILAYRSKGGVFHQPSDLKKMYGVTANDYNRLLPYIVIADSSRTKNTSFKKPAEPVVSMTELNSADSLQLAALPGIGPVLAQRILHFRKNLGGFYSIDQLKEVYGLSPETFELIRNKVEVDSSRIEKLDINHISITDLQKHLYFRNPAAKAIISYREEHGIYHAAADLNKIEILTEEQISRMQHYLEFVK